MSQPPRSVSLVTLGCARNEVDSEELAGRLGAGGWTLTDGDDADVVVINTCGFIDSAKKDSIDTVLAAADTGKKVVAVGCLAERYGAELAESLSEADAVLGFDSYADIAARLDDVAAGRPITPHTPRDRRTLLPVAPCSARPPSPTSRCPATPGCRAASPAPAWTTRRSPTLKLASGCDRRCTFCAIPTFRGSFVSRPPADVLAEAHWLAATGARELVLVSENSTSYGKDLGDLRALEKLLPDLAAVDGHRPDPGVVPAAGRAAALAARGAGHHARRRAVLRPVLPARQRGGAAPDEALRLDRVVPRPAGPGARASHPTPARAAT